jgi:hypothetical protein
MVQKAKFSKADRRQNKQILLAFFFSLFGIVFFSTVYVSADLEIVRNIAGLFSKVFYFCAAISVFLFFFCKPRRI